MLQKTLADGFTWPHAWEWLNMSKLEDHTTYKIEETF
jgi:hypothetical protein